MDSSTIVDLACHFDSKLANLHTAFDLNNAKHDPSCQKILCSVHKELEGLECILALMKSEVEKWKKTSSSVEDLKPVYGEVINDLKYAIGHLPARLPNRHVTAQQHVTEVPSKPDKPTTDSSSSNQMTTHKEKTVKEVVYCPPIDYLIVDEFDSVPNVKITLERSPTGPVSIGSSQITIIKRYMKGRLSYNQVNSVIDELNKAFVSKYKIMRMKKSKMSDVNRKRYDNYKLQESKDTPGVYFIVESDIKEFTTMKMDATSRSMLTMLRHCGRLREIRGGGITRYAIVESY